MPVTRFLLMGWEWLGERKEKGSSNPALTKPSQQSVSLRLSVFCFVMSSQPSSCLGCFSESELAQSGPIWRMWLWVNWAPPSPTPSFLKRETCSSVFSTLQNTAAMQQSVQKQPGACQICTDTARLLAHSLTRSAEASRVLFCLGVKR